MSSPVKDLIRAGCVTLMRGALRLSSGRFSPGPGGSLIVAPHADDETLGCGGLIASQTGAGRPVDIVFITDSAASHPGHPVLAPAELARVRRAEATSAAAVLGVAAGRLHFLGLPDGTLDKLPPDSLRGLVARLAGLIGTLGPSRVFVPYRDGGSTEHTAAFDATVSALAQAGGGTLLEYPVWAWWNPFRLLPRLRKREGNFRFALGPLRRVKMKALACHRSQIEPVPPWGEPALSPSLTQACCGPEEFFFERHIPASRDGR